LMRGQSLASLVKVLISRQGCCAVVLALLWHGTTHIRRPRLRLFADMVWCTSFSASIEAAWASARIFQIVEQGQVKISTRKAPRRRATWSSTSPLGKSTLSLPDAGDGVTSLVRKVTGASVDVEEDAFRPPESETISTDPSNDNLKVPAKASLRRKSVTNSPQSRRWTATFVEEQQLPDSQHGCPRAGSSSLPPPPNDDPAIDAFAEEVVERVRDYAASEEFAIQEPNAGGTGIELSVLEVKGTTWPVVRSRLYVDSADLPGDPMDLGGIFAQYTAVAASRINRSMVELAYNSSEVITSTQNNYVVWMSTKTTVSSNTYEYVLVSFVRVFEDALIVASASVPPKLLARLGVRGARPGFVRNELHAGGFVARVVGKTEHGYRLCLTNLMHTELDGPRGPLTLVVGGRNMVVALFMNLVLLITHRLHTCVAACLIPQHVQMSESPEEMVSLQIWKGVQTQFTRAAALPLETILQGDRPSASFWKPEEAFQELPLEPHAEVESYTRNALVRVRRFMTLENGWENGDVGTHAVNVRCVQRAVPWSKAPIYRARLNLKVPKRFGTSHVREAVAEVAAIYMSHSCRRLYYGKYNKSALLSRHEAGEVVWSAALWDAMGRPPTDCVCTRASEACASEETAEFLHASVSLPPDLSNRYTLPEEAAQHTRSDFGTYAIYFRAVTVEGRSAIEATFLYCPDLDSASNGRPKFLVLKDLVQVPCNSLLAIAEMFNAGLVPRVIESTGDCDGGAVSGPITDVVIADRVRTVDAIVRSALSPLLSGDGGLFEGASHR